MTETVKVCPECGQVLAGVDIQAHSAEHWPEYLDPVKSHPVARKRQAALKAGGVSVAEYNKGKEG